MQRCISLCFGYELVFKIRFTSEVLYWEAVCFFVFSRIADYVTEDKETNCAQKSAYEVI